MTYPSMCADTEVMDIKVLRKHAWVAITVHSLTSELAVKSLSNPVTLTDKMIVRKQGPICFYCEKSYGDAAESCPGEARN